MLDSGGGNSLNQTDTTPDTSDLSKYKLSEEQKQRDIAECQKMWDDGSMQKAVDANVLEREGKYVDGVRSTYEGQNIYNSDDNPRNIHSVSGDTEEGFARQMYYEALMRSSGRNLTDALNTGKPILIAEQDKGAGIELATSYQGKHDGYNDRMTLLTLDTNGTMQITEFNRANLEPSWNYPDVQSGTNKAIAADEYDFITGDHFGTRGLNIFDSKKIQNIPGTQDGKNKSDIIMDAYNKNTLTWQKVKQDFGEYLRRGLKNINGGQQRDINVHAGCNYHTGSKGCLTIADKDYKNFIDRFQDNKLGKLYLYR